MKKILGTEKKCFISKSFKDILKSILKETIIFNLEKKKKYFSLRLPFTF